MELLTCPHELPRTNLSPRTLMRPRSKRGMGLHPVFSACPSFLAGGSFRQQVANLFHGGDLQVPESLRACPRRNWAAGMPSLTQGIGTRQIGCFSFSLERRSDFPSAEKQIPSPCGCRGRAIAAGGSLPSTSAQDWFGPFS